MFRSMGLTATEAAKFRDSHAKKELRRHERIMDSVLSEAEVDGAALPATLYVTTQRLLLASNHGRHFMVGSWELGDILSVELGSEEIYNDVLMSHTAIPSLRVNHRYDGEAEWLIFELPARATRFREALGRLGVK